MSLSNNQSITQKNFNMANQFPTTGTEQGDINAGYINAGVYNPDTGSLGGTMKQPETTGPTGPTPVAAPTGGTTGATGPVSPTTTSGAGDPVDFALAMSAFKANTDKNNGLMTQRNLILKQLYDQPLTDAEKAQLDPTLLPAINSGDRNQIDMSLRLISDELAGRTGTIDQSVKYLADYYQQTVTQAETQRNDAISKVLSFATQYGSNAGKAMRSLYGDAYVQKLKDMGIDIDQFAKVSPATISQERYIPGITGANIYSSNDPTRIVNNNNPTAFTTDVAQQMGLTEGIDYVQGDGFTDANGKTLYTAKLLGDPIETTIRGIDQAGLYTGSGTPRWSYIDKIPEAKNWASLTHDQKVDVVKQMYKYEGGKGDLSAQTGILTANPQVIDPVNANVPDPLTGRTPNSIWQSATTLALDKSATVQKFLGGLSGASGQGKALKDVIANTSDGLIAASGVDKPTLQAQFAGNTKALATIIPFMNNIDRALGAAEQSGQLTQKIFTDKGINPNDSTWVNKTLNDLTKQFGSSGDIRAYQAAMVEVGNDYAIVFSRGGQRSVEGNAIAASLTDGNVKLSDIQKSLQTLQEIGQVTLQTSVDQVASIASGTGTDEVAKFLAYIHGVDYTPSSKSSTGDSGNSSSSSTSGGSYEDYLKAIGQ